MDRGGREAKSQPTLAQRIWSSSGDSSSAGLPKSRSHGPGGNRYRPASSVRPLSTIYSRPESRADSRPQSRVERPQSRLIERPQSRLDQEQLLERPKSGVRPLSGRVFMRRTSERGWIAKAYPDAGMRTTSQLELEDEDDFSDCDSFFDDDFDMETKDEKLGLLLSCNTLGVESKGRRPDWIAGEVDIPRFHCPRCRDHWYGISDLPCDEELARMKREGLWMLGKDGDKKLKSYGGGKTLRPVSSHREYNTLSGDSSAVKLPKIRQKKENEEEEREQLRGAGGDDDLDKKRRRRITFKLGDDSLPGSSEPSGVSLDGDELSRRKGQMSKDGDSGSSSRSGRAGDGELDGSGKGEGGQSGSGSEGGYGAGGSTGGQIEDGNGSKKKGKGGDDGLDVGRLGNRGSLLDDEEERRRRRLGQNGGEGGAGGGKASTNAELGSGSRGIGHRDGKGGYGSDGLGGSGIDQSGVGSGRNAASGMESGHNAGGTGMGQGTGMGNDGKNRNTGSGLDSSSRVSQAGSRGSGSRRSSLGMSSDHGKNVRKGVGYMRAVSPTSSEWGDPHHGRSFISSTATSRTGSTSNLLKDLDRSVEEEPKSRSLPAIVPQIKRKQPLMDFSDLMGGFQFTRAWTFSYHNKT